MSEHIQEQISEFIDDEMSVEACEFFVRRLERDDDARACYLRYQLIGAAVRGEHLAFNAAADGMLEPWAEDAALAAPAAGRRKRMAVGVGLAASFTLIAVFAFQMAGFEPGADLVQLDEPAQPDAMGMQYLMQHAGLANGLGRPFMQSTLIAGPPFDFGEDVEPDARD